MSYKLLNLHHFLADECQSFRDSHSHEDKLNEFDAAKTLSNNSGTILRSMRIKDLPQLYCIGCLKVSSQTTEHSDFNCGSDAETLQQERVCQQKLSWEQAVAMVYIHTYIHSDLSKIIWTPGIFLYCKTLALISPCNINFRQICFLVLLPYYQFCKQLDFLVSAVLTIPSAHKFCIEWSMHGSVHLHFPWLLHVQCCWMFIFGSDCCLRLLRTIQ